MVVAVVPVSGGDVRLIRGATFTGESRRRVSWYGFGSGRAVPEYWRLVVCGFCVGSTAWVSSQ